MSFDPTDQKVIEDLKRELAATGDPERKANILAQLELMDARNFAVAPKRETR